MIGPVTAALVLFGSMDASTHAPRADARDPWLAPDKVKHGVLAFAIQGGGYATLRLAADHRGAIAGATVVTAGLGLLKEWRDRRQTGFSYRDLAWDAAGIVLATIVVARSPQR